MADAHDAQMAQEEEDQLLGVDEGEHQEVNQPRGLVSDASQGARTHSHGAPGQSPHAGPSTHAAARNDAIQPMQELMAVMRDGMAEMFNTLSAQLTSALAPLQRFLPANVHVQGADEGPVQPVPEMTAADGLGDEVQMHVDVLQAQHDLAGAQDAMAELQRRQAAEMAALLARQQQAQNVPITRLETAQRTLNVGAETQTTPHMQRTTGAAPHVTPPRTVHVTNTTGDAQHNTPASDLRHFKPPAITKYGDKARAEHRDAADFLDDLKNWIELSFGVSVNDSQLTQGKLAMMTGMHTEGKVRAGWRGVEMRWRHELGLGENDPIPRTWHEIRLAFHELVGQPAMTRQDAFDTLIELGITQGNKTMVQYYTEFHGALMWCPDAFQADAVVALFVRGLADPYKAACSQDPVTLKPYPTLAQVYDKAKGMEKARKNQHSNQHRQTPPVSHAVQVKRPANQGNTSTSAPQAKKPKPAPAPPAGTRWCNICTRYGVYVVYNDDTHNVHNCPHSWKNPQSPNYDPSKVGGPSGSAGGSGGGRGGNGGRGGGAGSSGGGGRVFGGRSAGGRGGRG